MKKVFALLLAGIFGTGMLVSAAACGSDDDGGSAGGEQGGNPPSGEVTKPDRNALAFESAEATLNITGIDESASGKISDELYGVFLEDINYASQALDDNMVVNSSFETVSGAKKGNQYGWTAANGASLSVTKAGSVLEELYTYNNTNAVAEHAEVTTPAGGTLTNSGYTVVPMAVEEGTDYVFSAFIKASAALDVTVTVTDGTTEYATVTIPVSTGGWMKYERTVKATGTAAENLKLQLTFSSAATVSLDAVCFETTDSTVGIKNYLYDAIKDLSPKFIRFPGGCITEGENYEQAYDWKNSIGVVQTGNNAGDDDVPAFAYTLNTENGNTDVATYGEYITRRPNVNLWENNGSEYFLMDYGIGFYEYFLLCDSLGASALPVVNCGKNCQGQSNGAALPGRHNKQVADYIRDAADLIEFAKGDKNTKWGGIRAAMGHPEPFEMNYIGIGNEQWDNYFTDYYEKFLEDDYFMGMCKTYGVQLIVGNHQQLVHCEGSLDFSSGTPKPRTSGVARDAALAYMNKGKIASLGEYGVQDHHYYNSPVDFFLHTHMYDSYTRTGENRYEVFVGEYSANNTYKEAGNFSSLYKINGWFSALSEAAMMTGFERNGDIVKLSAYAPMFAPVAENMRHWAVDMMLFTNTELVRTANYYVQQIFMKNAGTRKLAASLQFAEGTEAQFTLQAGASATLDRLYYVASVDEATGDYIVKIVNADDLMSIKLNIDLGAAPIGGMASVSVLRGFYDDVNTLESEAIIRENYTIGNFSGSVAGITLPASSVTALRFHTK